MSARSLTPDCAYVPTEALAVELLVDSDFFHVRLGDGRLLTVPWDWAPRLKRATKAQRANYKINGHGRSLHWPEIDEDLSVANLLAGGDRQSA